MRKYLLAACAVAVVLGVSLPASAQPSAAPSARIIRPEIAALLTQFPAGGPWLRAAIARSVQSNPSLTTDAIFAIGICAACQGQSLRQGLADAAEALANGSESDRAAASLIRAALPSGGALMSVDGSCVPPMLGLSAMDPGSSAPAAPGFSSPGPATPNCISPSRPGC